MLSGAVSAFAIRCQAWRVIGPIVLEAFQGCWIRRSESRHVKKEWGPEKNLEYTRRAEWHGTEENSGSAEPQPPHFWLPRYAWRNEDEAE